MISDNDIDQNCKDLQTYACNKWLIKISMPNLGNQGRLIKTHFNNLIIINWVIIFIVLPKTLHL